MTKKKPQPANSSTTSTPQANNQQFTAPPPANDPSTTVNSLASQQQSRQSRHNLSVDHEANPAHPKRRCENLDPNLDNFGSMDDPDPNSRINPLANSSVNIIDYISMCLAYLSSYYLASSSR